MQYAREQYLNQLIRKKDIAAELPKYKAKALETGLPEDAQAANDFSNMIGRFEKKIHDLELTRTISVQMAPQTLREGR